MSMTETERRDRLSEYANADAQPIQPRGHALTRASTGIERIIGAQPVAVQRDEARVMQKLAVNAAMAGDDWFYRFPVKGRGGATEYIEGASIKLANDVARVFGNCAIEVRELDMGDAWTFYARFTDIETGFSMERAFRQRKSQTSMKTKDYDRQQDIAYSIGQSKAIRNVIVNSLQIFCDFAFREARDSLVDKIGKDADRWRERTVKGIAQKGVELARVERVVGRAAKDWLAPDIAQVIAMMKSIADGMATIDETFPTPESPKTASGAPTASSAGGGVGHTGSGGQAASDTTPREPAPAASRKHRNGGVTMMSFMQKPMKPTQQPQRAPAAAPPAPRSTTVEQYAEAAKQVQQRFIDQDNEIRTVTEDRDEWRNRALLAEGEVKRHERREADLLDQIDRKDLLIARERDQWTTARTQFTIAADILLKCFAAVPKAAAPPLTGAPHAPRTRADPARDAAQVR